MHFTHFHLGVSLRTAAAVVAVVVEEEVVLTWSYSFGNYMHARVIRYALKFTTQPLTSRSYAIFVRIANVFFEWFERRKKHPEETNRMHKLNH